MRYVARTIHVRPTACATMLAGELHPRGFFWSMSRNGRTIESGASTTATEALDAVLEELRKSMLTELGGTSGEI